MSAAILLRTASRVPLSQVVLDQLMEQIRNGSLRPGDRLPTEHELARALEVGRSSVREAFRGLIAFGLIETRPGRGAVVTHQARSPLAHLRSSAHLLERVQTLALLDLLEVRECLEGQAAELAAQRATPEDVVTIERAALGVERQVAAGRSYFRSNADFHRAIAQATHNNVLAESVHQLIMQVRELRERMMREMPGMPDRDIVEHRAIAEAIRRRRPGLAREAMVRHIRSFAALVRNVDPTLPAAGGRP